jgi:hypothetical protein
MLDHLKGEAHTEITEAINRSVQISVKKCRLHQCPFCPELFLLKFSLRNHVRINHGFLWFNLPGILKRYPWISFSWLLIFRSWAHELRFLPILQDIFVPYLGDAHVSGSSWQKVSECKLLNYMQNFHPQFHASRKSRSFECRFCFKRFSSKVEVQQHRRTLDHRIKVNFAKRGPSQINCQYCPQTLTNLIKLKVN